MLDRLATLLPTAARERLRMLSERRLPQPAGPGPAILPGFASGPAPMRPLHPPMATNDNPLQAVHEAVEQDLRANGHLT